MPENAMLNRADAGIMLFQVKFEVRPSYLRDDGANSPDLLGHGDRPGLLILVDSINIHSSLCIVHYELYSSAYNPSTLRMIDRNLPTIQPLKLNGREIANSLTELNS
jgi:hypothetical protein